MTTLPPATYQPAPEGRKKRRTGKIALLGCGGMVALVVLVIIIVIVVTASHGGVKTGTASTGTGSHSAGFGSPVRDGKFQFVVTKVTRVKSVGDTAAGLGETAQGEYAVLHVKVTNIGNVAQTLDDSAQYVYDGKGRKFLADTAADLDANQGNGGGVFLNQVNPGESVKGKILFDLPEGDAAVRAELHDSAFSGGVTVSLRPAA